MTVTEDLDVSGAVNPWRSDLAPWLSDNPPEPWDTLIVHKLDRLTRSLLDFQNLVIWLHEHGKSLVSVSESIDLGTPAGRMIANVLVMFAEFERERIGERRREAALALKALDDGEAARQYSVTSQNEGPMAGIWCPMRAVTQMRRGAWRPT